MIQIEMSLEKIIFTDTFNYGKRPNSYYGILR